MAINIFSEEAELFLKNKMCICIEDLTEKILKDSPKEINFFKKLMDFYLKIEIPHNPENNLTYIDGDENKEIFESCLIKFLDENELEDDSNTLKIYDELYHALRSYTREGLVGLYIHRDATFWYPKVVITKRMGSLDHIDSLDDEIIIYRGMSEEEFHASGFGQSWSLNKTTASKFAFLHYKGQPNYINTMRVVCKTKIKKSDIYFYRKGHSEEEIVVNPEKLISNSIQIIEKKVLEPSK